MADGKSDGGAFTHAPLPYVARVRCSFDDDSPLEVREVRVTAYSILEAILQAGMECGGEGPADQRVRVVGIEPDVREWARRFGGIRLEAATNAQR